MPALKPDDVAKAIIFAISVKENAEVIYTETDLMVNKTQF